MQLPDYFPSATKPCKLVANDFFTCFSANSMSIAMSEREASAVPVSKCEAELVKYQACMEGKNKTWLGYVASPAVSEKRFRVSTANKNNSQYSSKFYGTHSQVQEEYRNK